MESPIIRKKIIRENKTLKIIQKQSRKGYGKIKRNQDSICGSRGRKTQVKGKIFKVVQLQDQENVLDLTDQAEQSEQTILQSEKKQQQVKVQQPERMQPTKILERIQKSNLTGLSGSGFSTFQKLSTVLNSKSTSKFFIVNAVECDPGLLHDEWLLHNKQTEIKRGIELIKSCIPFQQVVVASKEAITIQGITCYQVPNRYPMGAEKLLIRQVLGKEINYDEIPAKKGILVLNVQTVIAIYEIIMEQKEFNSRYLTVADLTTGEAKIAKVNTGSNALMVLEKVLGKKHKAAYYGGGAMMASPLSNESLITETTNFIGYSEETIFDDSATCKKCGGCSRHCPMNLDVVKMVQLLEAGNTSEAKKYSPNYCIHCGTCSYYCRAGKNVMELIAKLTDDK